VTIRRFLSWVEGQTRRGASSRLSSAARPHATTKILSSYLLLEMSDFAINTIVMLIAKAMAASLICQRGNPKLLWAIKANSAARETALTDAVSRRKSAALSIRQLCMARA